MHDLAAALIGAGVDMTDPAIAHLAEGMVALHDLVDKVPTKAA